MFFSQEQPDDCPWSDIKLFETRIRGNIKLAESPSYGKTRIEITLTSRHYNDRYVNNRAEGFHEHTHAQKR